MIQPGGLATAHDTAAGAGHDFNQMVFLFAGPDLIHDLSGVCQTGSNADLHIHTVVRNGGFLDAIGTANAGGRDGRHGRGIVTGNQSAENSLRDAAGNAENDAGAGAKTEGHITGFCLKLGKVQAKLLDQTANLRSGQHRIRILHTVGVAVGTVGLHLLGSTGHDGDYINLLSAGMGRIGIVFLQQGGEHLLRGTAGGYILFEVREFVVHKLYPSRAAGGQQGKLTTICNTFQELSRLFHDCQVSRIGRIEHAVKAHGVQCSDQFAHDVFTLLDTEALTDGNTDGRSDLCDDANVLIAQGVLNLFNIIANGQSAGGAYNAALATADTLGVGQFFAKGRGDFGFRSTEGEVQRTDRLQLVTCTDTVAAQDTLVRIANNRGRGVVQRTILFIVGEANRIHTHTVGQILQNAVAALEAGGTVAAVGSEQQLHDQFAVLAQTFGICVNDHAVSGFFGAGGKQTAAVILHRTQTAGAEDGQLRLITQRGDINTGLANNRQQILFIGKIDFFTVNRNGSHDLSSLCFNVNCIECAVAAAGVTLDALGGIDGIGGLDLAGNGIDRTVLGALGTALAVLWVNHIAAQGGAGLSTALFVHNMLHIFVAESLQSADDG